MFKGKAHLRREGEYIEYTPEQIEEVVKCAEDPIYFAENYFTIINPLRGKETIKLYEFQKKMLKAYVDTPNDKTSVIINIPRQMGKTTLTTVYLLWYVLFNKDKTVAVIANKLDIAVEIVSRVKLAYESLPLWIQPGLKDDGWAQKKLLLGNGSKLAAATTSSSSISGLSPNIVFIDEFAKIDNNLLEIFWTATYPTISGSLKSKVIIVSTPLGKNLYYEIWSRAVRGLNNFFPIKVSWRDHPERDNEWKKRIMADFGPVRFRQEFECKFLGSSNTLIEPDTLEELFPSDPIEFKLNGLLSIYEHPIKGEKYVMGCDVSKGTGRDYSVIQVLKYRDQYDFEQVAVYRCNTINPKEFAGVIASIGKLYNNAYALVENNGYGELTLDILWYDLEYENLINPEKKKLGVTADRGSKRRGLLVLKEYIEKGFVIIRDKDTINELQNFEEVVNHNYTNASYACIGSNDDTISSLTWSLYYTTLPEFDGQVSTYKIEDKYKLDDEEDKKDDEDDSGPLYFFDE